MNAPRNEACSPACRGSAAGNIQWLSIVLLALLLTGRAGAAERVDFELLDVDTRPVRLSDYRGQWVVVNFWATWCGPCLTEIPLLNRYHRPEEGYVVLGINFEQIEADALVAFIDEFDVRYPVLLAGSEPLIPFEPLIGLPSTFLVSPKGEYVASHVGPVDESWLDVEVSRNGTDNQTRDRQPNPE